MRKKVDSSSNLDANHGQVVKKERHIVSWSREEDDILREQIRLHGSENWAIIASKFQDKTTRQCRRRWFTYLNSDFKKGGWSPEEDILLCEAQRIYGNRWTEIAKVVSGRTDNAVKNRFTTLCKKRAKHEAVAEVNSTTSYVNLNNKRVIFRNVANSDEGSRNAASLKKIRACFSSIVENQEKTAGECGAADHLPGHQFAEYCESKEINEALIDECKEDNPLHTFLNKDDPKVLALMQQAADGTDQILESTQTVLQDFLKQSKERQVVRITNGDPHFQLEKLEEDVRSWDGSSRSSLRNIDVCESSPAGSQHSTGSINIPRDKREESDSETAVFQAEIPEKDRASEQNGVCNEESRKEAKSTPEYEEIEADNGAEFADPSLQFDSPSQVTPLFRTLAAAIPSPRFSESEKHFLMKTLGLESSPIKNPSQPPPPCKRSLLHCL